MALSELDRLALQLHADMVTAPCTPSRGRQLTAADFARIGAIRSGRERVPYQYPSMDAYLESLFGSAAVDASMAAYVTVNG